MKRLPLDKLTIVGAVLFLIGLVAFGLSEAPSWFWHPLGYCPASLGHKAQIGCKGYNGWSGSFSDISEITLPLGMITFAIGWWVKHNCHVPGCPRIAWHPHPEHGHPVCKKDHPHSDPNHEVWDVHKS